MLSYAKALNNYVHTGKEKGWDAAGKEPKMLQIKKSLEPFLAALNAVNQPGVSSEERASFRADWPPAHAPLISHLQQNGQSIDTLFILDDGSILARIGSWYEDGHVVHIQGDSVVRVDGVEYIGRCPARRYFAVAQASGVQVTDGWQGPVVALCPWPSGLEGLPAAAESPPLRELTFSLPARPTQLQPFPDGQRVLLVCSVGIFVLAAEGATRLLPRPEELAEKLMAEKLLDDGLDADDFSFGLSMEHGAVSPDGLWVAAGCQDGLHRVFNAALENVGTIGPASEYPHFALFNSRSDHAIFNACHFYNGATLGVAVADWSAMKTDYYAEDPRAPTLQQGARVYCAAHRQTADGGQYIIGDAHGYLRAFSEIGEDCWQQFIGSTVGAIDISADGQTLVAATSAGFIAIIDLKAAEPEAWQIGVGAHREVRRWVFWKEQAEPLRW